MSRFALTILLNIVLSCCWSAPASSAAAGRDNPATEPIHIEAARMESDQRQGSVLFVGKVEATQGDLIIRAEQMTVFYRKTGDTAGAAGGVSKNIENLTASGNVTLTKQDWLASGDRMEFETEGRKVILTGNTKVWQGNNTVTGDKIIIYLDEGKSVVENQGDNTDNRVKAFFYPESDKTKTVNE
ncbi:MAG: lipopolysaccharide transport periplasmic protein LptA [Desulfobulbaceae bacterium]|nr:lipopolysaccharide transport periplasmic protein LptA [Desulfobulbaceae bacterium]